MEKTVTSPSGLGFNFAKLWISNAVSALGDGAILAAGPLLVASKTDSPALIAMAIFAQQLPWLLFSLLSGVYVDRNNRQHTLIAANILRAVAIGLLALAIVMDISSLPFIYAALFLLGIGNTIADNAAVAFLPTLVDSTQLGKANARLQSANLIGKQLIGPSLGAYLFIIAAAIPFGLDALTFVIAALIIGTISPAISHEPREQGRQSIKKDIAEGIAWLWHSPFLKTLAFTIAILNITFMGAFATFVLFTAQRLGLDAVGYGIMLTLSAVGGIVGSLVAPTLQSKLSVSTLLRAGLITEALIDFAFVFVRSPEVAGLLYALFGMHAVVWGIITVSLRQSMIPASLLGRVNSVYNLFRMGGVAIGALLGGLIAESYGITAPFWIAGIGVTALTIVTWRRFGQPEKTL